MAWQFLELSSPIDIVRLGASPAAYNLNFVADIVHCNPGDAFIFRFNNDSIRLFVNIGTADRLRYWIMDIEHRPLRTLDLVAVRQEREQERLAEQAAQRERERAEHLARFNMSLQHTSENFYWYSNNASSRWLPEMARELEQRTSEMLDALGITLTHRIPIFYYNRDDFEIAYPDYAGLSPRGYPGFADESGVFVARPRGSTVVTPMTTGHLAHEVVHVLQAVYFPPDWEVMNRLGLQWLGWVIEGTATYIGHGQELFLPNINEHIQSGNFPTLAQLSDHDIFYAGGGWVNYCWAATIIQFIHETWGMEYVVEMNRRHGDYQGIFGISRAEFERRWHTWLRANYR
jgi:hypothetical protein